MSKIIKKQPDYIITVFFIILILITIFISLAFSRYRKIEPTEWIGLSELLNFVAFYDGWYHKTASIISWLPITYDMKITHSFWDYGVFHVFVDLTEAQANKLYIACKNDSKYSLFPYVSSFHVWKVYGIEYSVQDVSYDDWDIWCYFSSKSDAERDGIAYIKLNASKKELSINVPWIN